LVDRFNHRRLLEPVGKIQPADAGMSDYAERETRAAAA
jgi:hypothetical protein